MGSKQIRPCIPEIVSEKAVFFNKEEDGFFRRVEKITFRDVNLNKIISENEVVSSERYTIVTDEDYDHQMKYQDIDGNDKFLNFKMISDENQ
jgi:hypothetical protein